MKDLMNRRLKPTETTTEQGIRQAVIEEFHLETEGLANVDSALLQEMNIQADRYISKRTVPTIGSVPLKKADGTWRWLFGNANGLITHRACNYKASQLREINATYDLNGLAFCKVGIDTRCFKASESITYRFCKLRTLQDCLWLTTNTSLRSASVNKEDVVSLLWERHANMQK
jgi:hypothetical protein